MGWRRNTTAAGLSHTLTHSPRHSLTLTLSHSLTHTHTHTHTLTHTHILKRTHALTHTLTRSLSHTHSLSLSHTHTHTLAHLVASHVAGDASVAVPRRVVHFTRAVDVAKVHSREAAVIRMLGQVDGDVCGIQAVGRIEDLVIMLVPGYADEQGCHDETVRL